MFKNLMELIRKTFTNTFTGALKTISINKLRTGVNTTKVKKYGITGVAAILLSTFVFIGRNNEKLEYVEYSEKKKPKIADASRVTNESSDDDSGVTFREKHNFINKVVNRCAPAVFFLEVRNPYKMDVETGEPMVTSNGSGFVISEDGWALTNAHVVIHKPQSTTTAIMTDGSRYKVRVEDIDVNMDLALLKLEALSKLPYLDFGRAGDTAVGEWVVALGSPLSLSNSVTVGVVSSVDRPAEELGLRNYSMKFIQTDASITFGNSGGPLINLDGNVIGINNLRLTSGISFAIPIEYARKFLENSKYRIKSGKSTGPMGKTLYGMTTLSITADILTDLLRDNKDIPKDLAQGLLVWTVVENSPAAESGLQVGDIITHINGTPVKDPGDVYAFTVGGETTSFNLIHQGKKKTVYLDTKKLDP